MANANDHTDPNRPVPQRGGTETRGWGVGGMIDRFIPPSPTGCHVNARRRALVPVTYPKSYTEPPTPLTEVPNNEKRGGRPLRRATPAVPPISARTRIRLGGRAVLSFRCRFDRPSPPNRPPQKSLTGGAPVQPLGGGSRYRRPSPGRCYYHAQTPIL